MARRGRKRRLELEAEYWRLLAAGVGTVEACKQLGIGRKTGYRWRAENGGDRGAVVQLAPTGRRVATKLAGDRRWSTAQPAPDLTDSGSLCSQQGYLFTLMKRQIPPRERSKIKRRHAPTLPEPPGPGGRGHTDHSSGLLAQEPLGDLTPELALDLPPQRRRPRLTSSETCPSTPSSTLPACPSHLHSWGCCDDRLNPPSTPVVNSPMPPASSGFVCRSAARVSAGTTPSRNPSSPH